MRKFGAIFEIVLMTLGVVAFSYLAGQFLPVELVSAQPAGLGVEQGDEGPSAEWEDEFPEHSEEDLNQLYEI